MRREKQEREKTEEEYLNKKYEILRAMSERGSKSICSNKSERHLNVEQWVEEQARNVGAKQDPPPNLDQERRIWKDEALVSRMITANTHLRELPTFNGNYNEWPIFYSNYVTSTKECGYTNEKNLIRLQRAIQVDARSHTGISISS